MSTDAIASAGSTSSTTGTDSTSSSSGFSEADFYKLLIAEMQNQDPTDPVDNKEMVLQLAQFSACQSTQSLNSNMSSYITTASLGTATGLIGKTVTYLNSEGTYESGTVTAVKKSDDSYTVTINNSDVALSSISQIAPTTTTATTTSTATN